MSTFGFDANLVFDTDGKSVSTKLSDVNTALVNNAQKQTNSSIDLVVDFGNLKSPINGGYDWSPAIDAAVSKAKSLGVKLRIPAGTYYISRSIDISGLVLEGDETSVFNAAAMGTWIKCLTKDFPALKQMSTAVANLTHNIKNLIITDADIGLYTTYSVNSSFENLFFSSCNLAIKHGDSTILGSLFNTFKNMYTNGCDKALDINGSSWANNNLFLNCYFGGATYSATIDCTGGIGAVNNTFIACEFQSANGFGIQLGSTRRTNINDCYFECKAAAIVWNKYQEATTVRGGVFGSLRNDNALGHSAFIVATATAGGYIFVDAPYVYLPAATTNANLSFVDTTAVTSLYLQVRWGLMPRIEGSPTGFTTMKNINSYDIKRATAYNLTAIAASSDVPNNSFYVDSATNTLKYKDNNGVSKTVTLT